MAFPTTSLLDDFNRADAPTTLGASWVTGGPDAGWTSSGILSNRLYSSTGSFTANRWAVSFGADQEVWMTVPVFPATGTALRMYGRLQNAGTSGWNAYYLQLSPTGAVDMFRTVGGSVLGLMTAGSTYVAGDQIGLQMTGTSIRIFRNGVDDGGLTNSEVTGAGLLCVGFPDTSVARVDNFGGGDVVLAEKQSFYVTRRRTTMGARR